LVATPITVESPAAAGVTTHPTVHLVYNHLFTILEFNIKGSGNFQKIRLTGLNLALGGATVNIAQSTPTAGLAYTLSGGGSLSPTVIVELPTAVTLSTTVAIKVYMVIYPGTGRSTDDLCTIDFFNGSTWTINAPDKQAPAGGFLRGQYYTVPVNAGAL